MSTHVTNPSAVAAESGALKRARLLWDTISRREAAVVSASGAEEGFPASAAASPDTYSFWRPDAANGWWKVDAGAETSVDALGIAAHDLGTTGAELELEHSANDSDWNSVGTIVPLSNAPLLWLFPAASARYWRVTVGNAAVPSVGVFYIGKALVMQRSLYIGHTPLTLSRETVIRPATSEGGQWLGRSIVRRGLATQAAWKHLTPTWYRETFEPFAKSARRYPYFFAWRPDDFPDEIGYVWTPGDITPSITGPRGMLAVTVSMQGWSHE